MYFDKLVPVPADLLIWKLIGAIKKDAIKKDIYNSKIRTIEDEIRDITNLATYASLNATYATLATNSSLNAKQMRLNLRYLILLTKLLPLFLLLLKII